MKREEKIAYAEVYSFVNSLEKEDKQMIPTSLIEFLQKNMDKSMIKEFNPNIPINQQITQKGTYTLIAMIYLKYLCDNEYEKMAIWEDLKQNEKKKR